MTVESPLDQLDPRETPDESTAELVAELRAQCFVFVAEQIGETARRIEEAGTPEPRDLACMAELVRALEAMHLTERTLAKEGS